MLFLLLMNGRWRLPETTFSLLGIALHIQAVHSSEGFVTFGQIIRANDDVFSGTGFSTPYGLCSRKLRNGNIPLWAVPMIFIKETIQLL